MGWQEQVRKLVALGVERMRRRRHLADISEEAGFEKSYAAQLKSRPQSVRVGTFLQLLAIAGDECPADVFHQAFSLAGVEPVRLLACNRRREGLAPAPFLVEAAPKILALHGPGPDRRWRSRLQEIRKLEMLRFSKLPVAQAKLEALVRLGIALCAKTPRPRSAYCDLACALASLAVVYRTAGRLDDALDTLMLAWPLAMVPGVPHVEGIWNQKAAYLAAYLNRTDLGLDFARRAAVHFIEAEAEEDQARSLVDLGFLCSRAGQSEEACQQLRRALKVLPVSDREYRLAAHQILAGEYANLGLAPEAIRELNQAEELIAEHDQLLRASLSWGRARLLVAEGDMPNAVPAFEVALRLLRAHGSPSDVAEVTLDYAELLLRQKSRPELTTLAAGCATYFGGIECDRQVREAMEDFVALVKMEQHLSKSFSELRGQLPQSSQWVAKKLQVQPPGGICQPISGSALVAELLFGGGAGSESSKG